MMTLSSALKTLGAWLQELATAVEAPSRIAELEKRILALETRDMPTDGSPLAQYTHNPETWPRRDAKTQTRHPERGRKEYSTDGVDLKITIAVLRHDPGNWDTTRRAIASRRRLTLQQVAELKARITRLKLLNAA